MLPGDYIAMRLTAKQLQLFPVYLKEFCGFQFRFDRIFLLHEYGIDADLIPPLTPTFGEQGRLSEGQLKNLAYRKVFRHISCWRPAQQCALTECDGAGVK